MRIILIFLLKLVAREIIDFENAELNFPFFVPDNFLISPEILALMHVLASETLIGSPASNTFEIITQEISC